MAIATEEPFLKRWQGHIEELIHISARKPQVIEAKHQSIVQGACQVFFKKGFHPATMREIADAAGMSMGQMYHYISSKADELVKSHAAIFNSYWGSFLVGVKMVASNPRVLRNCSLKT